MALKGWRLHAQSYPVNFTGCVERIYVEESTLCVPNTSQTIICFIVQFIRFTLVHSSSNALCRVWPYSDYVPDLCINFDDRTSGLHRLLKLTVAILRWDPKILIAKRSHLTGCKLLLPPSMRTTSCFMVNWALHGSNRRVFENPINAVYTKCDCQDRSPAPLDRTWFRRHLNLKLFKAFHKHLNREMLISILSRNVR